MVPASCASGFSLARGRCQGVNVAPPQRVEDTMSVLHALPALGVLLQTGVPHQDSLSSRNGTVPVARAAELQGDLTVDGRLDEAAWRSAPAMTAFVQREPVEGAPPE